MLFQNTYFSLTRSEIQIITDSDLPPKANLNKIKN